MAKLKSKINSKYKATPKRKLVLGGLEDSPYLGKTLYESQTAPNAMFEAQSNVLQTQFEKDKAARDEQLQRNLLDRQMLEMQMANSATEQRQQEEQTQRDIAADTNTQQVQRSANRAVGTGLKTGFQAARNAYQLQQSTNAAMAAAKPSIQYGWEMGSTIPAGPSSPIVQSATKAGLQAGAKAVGGAALVAAPEIAGQIASNQLNKADDRQIKKQGKSQYFDDTDYSSKEYNAQLLESTGRGATIGGTIASAIPIPGIATGAGMAIGAAVGLGAGLIKAQHQRRMTKSENERGFKIGDKRFGKKLLFGEENVYDENLDPTVIEKRNREAQLQAMTNTANAMENARMTSMAQSDLNTGFALKNSTFEAKYGGSVKKLKGGVAKSIGRGAVEYVGKKHEHGGIDLPGNIEVEGGETEQNDYVFSATLKLPNGTTYAQAHKNLIKSGATGEEIHQLALSQEAAAGRNPNEIKGMKFAKYGGPLQYDKGGKKEPDIVVGGRSKEYWQNLSAFCAKNPRHYSCLSGDNGTTGNEARKVNGVNQGIVLEMLDESGNPVNTYEDYLKAIENSKRTDFAGGKSYSASVPNYHIVKDGKYTEEELKNMPLDKYMEIATPYINKRIYNIDYINGDAYYKGLLPNLSREEFEYYKGLRDNPDTTIYNPANGSTIPNPELFTEDVYGQGPAVEFNTTSPAGEYSEQAAKNAPKTRKGKEVFNRLQNSLKERTAQRAEANKVYNSNELPEATVTGSKPQQQAVAKETPSNYFTSGQFAADQRAQGPTTIEGRDKKYWQDLECIMNPDACQEKAIGYPRVYKDNYRMRDAALGNEPIKGWMSNYDKYNAQTLPNFRAKPYGPLDYVQDASERSDIERPFTDQEIAYYKGEADSPNTPSYVVDDRLVRETETPSPSMKGKDAMKFERTQPQLAQYNLPATKSYNSTFVPDEEPTAQNQVTAAIANSGLSTEEFAKQTGVDPEIIKGIQAGTVNLNPDEQAMLIAAIPNTPAVTANTTATNPTVTQTVTTNNPPVTTQTNNPPVTNTNTNMPTTTYTTAGKAITTPTTDGKPRFFMGASRIVDENGNVQILTDRPLMGHGAMSGSRLGTPGPEGLESVRSNSYDAAGNLKIGAEYKDKKTGENLSSSYAVADRETIAGTEWGKRWGYKPGMSEKEAKAAHDAFAAEMRTKFDQSPDEMLGYYQYLIDSGKVDPKTGTRDFTGEDAFGDDARAIFENLKSKGYIDADGKIKKEALSYLKTQATNEFVGPIHNAAGAYSLKGRPTPVKIPEDTPKDDISIPPPTPDKKDYTIDIPPPPTYTRTKSTNGLGLIQAIPAAAALTNNIKTKDIAPSLATGYVQPGAIGRVNLGRISYNAERASNQANNAAMNQALQNMSGPGAVAGMLAAKTKADQQALQIGQAEQNTNMGRAGEEAKINAGISQFNVGQAMAAQQTNAQLGQANAARMQETNKFNTQVKYARDVENREQRLGALDRGAQAITMNALANRQIDATENLAMVQDYTNAYKRYLETIAPTLGVNTTTTEDKTKTTAKFGGVKKYVSRLGDLKNNRTFKA